jgi:hypothetical protein
VPPLPPVSQVVKLTLGWSCDLNLKAESILHFKYTGGPPVTADLNSIANSALGFAATDLCPYLWTSNGLTGVTVLDLNSNTGAQGQYLAAHAGTMASAPNPAGTCVVLNHAIARRYRGGKPRTYAPFGTGASINSTGTWNTTFATNCATAWQTWINSLLTLTTASCTLSVYGSVSYYSGKALRATPAFDPILATSARTRIGSQRRRLKTA